MTLKIPITLESEGEKKTLSLLQIPFVFNEEKINCFKWFSN